METRQSTEFRTSLSTAQHRPSPECSAPPQPVAECDLVTVPARQGLEAVDILRRGSCDAVGPVLHDDGCDTLGFLVPPGTADAWDVPGSICTQTNGRGLSLAPEPRSRARTGCCRPARRTSPPTRPCCGPRWARRPG